MPKFYYSPKNQINDCFDFLKQPHKDAHSMDGQELEAAEIALAEHFAFVEDPNFVQCIPLHVATQTKIMGNTENGLPKPNVQLWIESANCGGAAMFGEDGKWYWTYNGRKTDECKVEITRWSYL